MGYSLLTDGPWRIGLSEYLGIFGWLSLLNHLWDSDFDWCPDVKIRGPVEEGKGGTGSGGPSVPRSGRCPDSNIMIHYQPDTRRVNFESNSQILGSSEDYSQWIE